MRRFEDEGTHEIRRSKADQTGDHGAVAVAPYDGSFETEDVDQRERFAGSGVMKVGLEPLDRR